MVRTAYRKMINVIEMLLIVGLTLIVLFTAYEVFMREVFTMPTLWTNEITSYLLVWLGMLGVVYAYDKGTHVSVDLVYRHLGGRTKSVCNIITAALTLMFGFAILVYGYNYWWIGYSQGWKHFGMLDVPTGYTRIALPICGILLTFQVCLTIYDQLRSFRPEQRVKCVEDRQS